ncbi:MAG: toll/interleukin-1 receptor domain-containing protein [Thermoguttaceae bacterium]|nr:toll/interleukin-1 receptor domain-containing protein [Thermoguttaceae bacterium]
MPIPQNYLRQIAQRNDISFSIKAAERNPLYKIFLCHSHKDKELVEGLFKDFKRLGIFLYVDWLDPLLPSTPDQKTAEAIQRNIKEAKRFFFLATEHSKASVWCPWEIGYADALGKEIVIIPTYNDISDACFGNEYLHLYPHIDIVSKNSKVSYIMIGPNIPWGKNL